MLPVPGMLLWCYTNNGPRFLPTYLIITSCLCVIAGWQKDESLATGCTGEDIVELILWTRGKWLHCFPMSLLHGNKHQSTAWRLEAIKAPSHSYLDLANRMMDEGICLSESFWKKYTTANKKMAHYGSVLTFVTVIHAIAAAEIFNHNLLTSRGKISSNSSSMMTSLRVRGRLECSVLCARHARCAAANVIRSRDDGAMTCEILRDLESDDNLVINASADYLYGKYKRI